MSALPEGARGWAPVVRPSHIGTVWSVFVGSIVSLLVSLLLSTFSTTGLLSMLAGASATVVTESDSRAVGATVEVTEDTEVASPSVVIAVAASGDVVVISSGAVAVAAAVARAGSGVGALATVAADCGGGAVVGTEGVGVATAASFRTSIDSFAEGTVAFSLARTV